MGLVAANGVLKSIDGLPLGEFILYISRMGNSTDAVVFLSGPKSSFITGECLTVDGGLLAKGAWADNETPGLMDQI